MKRNTIITPLFLAFMFLVLPVWLILNFNEPFTWFAIVGSVLIFIGKAGEYFASGKTKIFDSFSLVAKIGIITMLVGLIPKGIGIIRQKEVYAFGTHVQGPVAVTQGVGMIIVSLIAAVLVIKYVE